MDADDALASQPRRRPRRSVPRPRHGPRGPPLHDRAPAAGRPAGRRGGRPGRARPGLPGDARLRRGSDPRAAAPAVAGVDRGEPVAQPAAPSRRAEPPLQLEPIVEAGGERPSRTAAPRPTSGRPRRETAPDAGRGARRAAARAAGRDRPPPRRRPVGRRDGRRARPAGGHGQGPGPPRARRPPPPARPSTPTSGARARRRPSKGALRMTARHPSGSTRAAARARARPRHRSRPRSRPRGRPRRTRDPRPRDARSARRSSRSGLADRYAELRLARSGRSSSPGTAAGVSAVDRADRRRRVRARASRRTSAGRLASRRRRPRRASPGRWRRRLAGDRRVRIELDLRGRTEFETAVWLKALEIPRGEVRPVRLDRRRDRPAEGGPGRRDRARPQPRPARRPLPPRRPERRARSASTRSAARPRKRTILAAEGLDPDAPRGRRPGRGPLHRLGHDPRRLPADLPPREADHAPPPGPVPVAWRPPGRPATGPAGCAGRPRGARPRRLTSPRICHRSATLDHWTGPSRSSTLARSWTT